MSKGMEWLSRTLAVMIFMIGPALLGSYFDQQLGTSYLTIIGLVFGMLLSTATLLILVNKLAPKGRGKALSDEDWNGEDQSKDDWGQDE